MESVFPYGKIKNTQDLGDMIRKARKSQGATQAELAALCGVGARFISELENGKPTVQMGKVLQVVQCLGLEMSVQPRDGYRDGTAE